MKRVKHEIKDGLSLRSVFAFGFGGGSLYFIDILFISFIMYFYTNVFGLDPGKVGTMLMIAKIWDGINDPIIGMLEDRTKTKWGKARPFLLFASVPTALLLVLTFAAPDLSPDAKMVWAYCTYIGLGMLYTVVTAAMMALVPLMTKKPAERVKLNQARMLGTTILGVVASAVAMPLIKGVGYFVTAICFGLIFAIAMIILFFNSKEIDYGAHVRQKTKVSIMLQIKTVFGNIHCMKIAIAHFFMAVGGGIAGGSMLYYLSDFLGNADIFSVVQPISMVASIISILVAGIIIKKLGKKRSVIMALLIIIATLVVRLITKDSSIVLFVIMQVILTMATGIYSVNLIPMFADTVEYGESKTGIRAETLTMTTYTLFSKVGAGIGTAIFGKLLKVINYVPNAVQTDSTLRGLMHCNITSYIVALGITLFIILTYNLSEKKVAEIQKDRQEKIAAMQSEEITAMQDE